MRWYGFTVGLLLAFVTGAPSAADAQVLTDVNKELTTRLASKPMLQKQRFTERERTECWGARKMPCSTGQTSSVRRSGLSPAQLTPQCFSDSCHRVVEKIPYTVLEPAISTSWEIVEVSGFSTNDAKMVRFPDRTFIKHVAKSNCSKEESTISETLQFTTSSSATTSITRGVQSTKTLKADVSFKAPAGFGGSLGAQITQQTSFNRTESETTTKSIVNTVATSEKVAPMTEKSVDLIVYETSLEVPFSGSILVDGQVDGNLDGVVSVSKILDKQERLIPIEGVLAVTASTDSRTVVTSRALSKEECARQASPTVMTVTDLRYVGKGPNSLSGDSRRKRTSSNVLRFKTLLRSTIGGTPGNWCYTGPCNLPPDGYRETCYFDEEGACSSCGDEPDPVCDPSQFPDPGK